LYALPLIEMTRAAVVIVVVVPAAMPEWPMHRFTPERILEAVLLMMIRSWSQARVTAVERGRYCVGVRADVAVRVVVDDQDRELRVDRRYVGSEVGVVRHDGLEKRLELALREAVEA